MDRFEETQEIFGIRKYDGYKGTPIWTQENNSSTYYDYNMDTQCYVPAQSAREIFEELGIEP